VLASATLSGEVLNLKKIVLHNAVVMKLQEPELPSIFQLTHFYIPAEEDEKASILLALFKLHLVKGKTIIFTNSVEKSYK
jgi:ATP-dependent RNA helicase DDX56/DBP9